MAELRIDEVCSSVVDCEHKTVPEDMHGSAWAVGTPAMNDGQIDFSRAKRISDDTYDLWTRRAIPVEGDLILAREAPVGPVVRVPASPRVALGQRTVLLRPRPDVIDSRYLHFLLMSSDMQHRMHSKSEGSTVRHLNVEDVRALPLPALPPLVEQRAIVGVLGAIDDKIETNRRLIETLDELYMAECESVLSVSSENVSLGEVASLSLGGTPSKASSSFWEGGDIPWINSGRLHEFPVLTPSDFITAEGLSKSATKLIPKGSTVVAITGATLGVASRLAIDTTINQSIVAVECPGNVALNGFMLYALRANMAELVSSATGAAQQHVNKANFEELVISIPASKDRGLLRDIPSLIGQIDVLAHENVTLSILRNTLLPELLSGRLRVKDAESMMENV